MRIYTIDELAKGREVSLKDYPGYRGHGRGPDKQKRRRRGTGSFANDTQLLPWVIAGEVLRRKGHPEDKNFVSKFSRKLKGLYRDNPRIRRLLSGEGNEGRDYAYKLAEKMVAEKINKSEITPQDEKNIDLIRAMVDKNPDLQKKLEGPIKWVGQEGFDTCVAHLSGKKGITNAKALCGYLKDEARHKGELIPAHMGSQEKKKYQAKKGKK